MRPALSVVLLFWAQNAQVKAELNPTSLENVLCVLSAALFGFFAYRLAHLVAKHDKIKSFASDLVRKQASWVGGVTSSDESGQGEGPQMSIRIYTEPDDDG